MRRLSELLKVLTNDPPPSSLLGLMDLEVVSITSDSRKVTRDGIFVAVHGSTQDGHEFISTVAQSGAALIIGELEAPAGLSVPYFRVNDSREALALLSSTFNDHPSRSLKIVGITGTSGKTTSTYLVEAILKAAGEKVGVIGTVNFRFADKIYPSTHTTPGPVELQALLAQMRNDGCTAVVMEVSSHALKQKRTDGIAFDAMLFTNLTPEHLDFHPDMEDYYRAKATLFRHYAYSAVAAAKHPAAAVNGDDSYGRRLLSELVADSIPIKCRSFSVSPGADVSIEELRVNLKGVNLKIKHPHGSLNIQSPLLGDFNVSNILGAVTVSLGMGVDCKSIQKGIEGLHDIPGRLERVPYNGGVHVLVDYAHKSDALEKVLKTLKNLKGSHRLFTVFGCGGDRDRLKRPVMGKTAVALSDFVFITSDNPRTEDPASIISEILRGTVGHSNFEVEPDRKKAIFQAILKADAGDIVLIAGKGHEDYQIVGKTKVHFDDREIALEALGTR